MTVRSSASHIMLSISRLVVSAQVLVLEEDLRRPHALSPEVGTEIGCAYLRNCDPLFEDVLACFNVSLETGLTHSQARG